MLLMQVLKVKSETEGQVKMSTCIYNIASALCRHYVDVNYDI